MTSTTMAPPAAATTAEEAPKAPPTREFLPEVDPTTLDIGGNVREVKESTANTIGNWAEFVADIAENGVEHVITAFRRSSDNGLQVLDGQLRTLAAREAGRTVPVRVVAVDISELDRISHQYRANKFHHEMTAADEAKAIQDVLDLGVTPTKAAKQLRVDIKEVKAVQALAKSDAARSLVGDGQLSLTEAAAAAEFADDDVATARLVAAAGRGGFDHALALVRADRDAENARADVIAEHRAKGFEVLDETVPYSGYASATPFHMLRVDAERRQPTVEDIKNPANWAVYFAEEERVTLAATGERVDDYRVDWRTSNDPHTVARKGRLHATEVQVETCLTPSYYCRDAAAEGLRSVAGSDEDAEAIAAEKAAKAAAAQRSGLCNELARTATPVRREWVHDELAKGLPVGALLWAVRVLSEHPGLISENAAADIAKKLAGTKGYALPTGQARSKAAIDRAAERAQVVVVAMVLGAIEARMQPNEKSPHYWRGGTLTAGANPERRRGLIADYLALLSSWGYPLSRIDAVALGTADVDEVAAEAKAARAAAKKAAKKK